MAVTYLFAANGAQCSIETMTENDNLENLTDDELNERLIEAEEARDRAQRDYDQRTTNLSSNPAARMPEIPMSELQALDRALESAEENLRVIEEEKQRRVKR